METKEIKISVPEGYEIDKENSTFEKIVFKKKEEEKRWRDDETAMLKGYFIGMLSTVVSTSQTPNCHNEPVNYNVFATEKQVKSALAMARISQIMANDKRFGGPITDEEWKKNNTIIKYVIVRYENEIICSFSYYSYRFLAFHTSKQRDLFLKENEDLVKDYLMIG